MQQFALASISPLSIAWLVYPHEWERFEEIVQYNCAMLGGYFNVLIPLTEQGTFSPIYERFLQDYDPDLIVLPPGMVEPFLVDSHAFSCLPWDQASRIPVINPHHEDMLSNQIVVAVA